MRSTGASPDPISCTSSKWGTSGQCLRSTARHCGSSSTLQVGVTPARSSARSKPPTPANREPNRIRLSPGMTNHPTHQWHPGCPRGTSGAGRSGGSECSWGPRVPGCASTYGHPVPPRKRRGRTPVRPDPIRSARLCLPHPTGPNGTRFRQAALRYHLPHQRRHGHPFGHSLPDLRPPELTPQPVLDPGALGVHRDLARELLPEPGDHRI